MKHPTMYHHPLETPYESVVDERQQLSYQGRPILLTLLRPSSPTKVNHEAPNNVPPSIGNPLRLSCG